MDKLKQFFEEFERNSTHSSEFQQWLLQTIKEQNYILEGNQNALRNKYEDIQKFYEKNE